MTIYNTVSQFLKDFKYKLEFYGAIYLDNRLKNTQSLFELGITPYFPFHIAEFEMKYPLKK